MCGICVTQADIMLLGPPNILASGKMQHQNLSLGMLLSHKKEQI